jgi:endonuclease YncB( thermonuclease family)
LSAAAWVTALALVVPLTGSAEVFTGKVVRVADGDTFTVLVDREQIKVRLAEIDAPERGQPWSKRAKQALETKISGCIAEVSWTFNDRYGRRVGHVRCGGRDVNRELVREGHAWVSRRWMRDETLLDDEARARADRAGLWSLSEADRVPPWQWREGGVAPAEPLPAVPPSDPLACAGKRYCREMTSCEEARYYLKQCGLGRLDGDGDGEPCEALCR